MSDFLLDVNLQQLPEEYLTGEWRVAERVLNRADPGSLLAQATALRLQAQHLQLEAPTSTQQGAWAIQRDDLMQRPYLQLELAQENTRALITRLRRSSDGEHRQLTLYFLSGMEVQLTQP